MVLLITGIIFGLVLLAVDDGRLRLLERETSRLQALLELALQEAVLTSSDRGLYLHRQGYAFLRYQDEQWHLLSLDAQLRPRQLPPELSLTLEVEGVPIALNGGAFDEAAEVAPQIYLLSSGEFSAFTLRLQLDDGRIAHVTTGNDGRIQVRWHEN